MIIKMSELVYRIPKGLCPEARAYMKHILTEMETENIGVKNLDQLALDQLAWTIHTYTKAKKEVLKEGFVVKETNARNTTIRKPHPAVKIMYDSNAQMIKLLQMFGMTPKSRGASGQIRLPLEGDPLKKFKIV
jgi:P27 family predicted phage terminase small subunit